MNPSRTPVSARVNIGRRHIVYSESQPAPRDISAKSDCYARCARNKCQRGRPSEEFTIPTKSRVSNEISCRGNRGKLFEYREGEIKQESAIMFRRVLFKTPNGSVRLRRYFREKSRERRKARGKFSVTPIHPGMFN